MRFSRWLQRQPRWRLFLMIWGIQFLVISGAILGTCLGSDAYAGFSLRAPPLWVFAGLAIVTALLAALNVWQLQYSWRRRAARVPDTRA